MSAPEWLTPYLEEGETVRWAEAPGDEAWRRALAGIAIGAYMTFYLGIRTPSWWQLLPIWPERTFSPTLAALVAGVGFFVDAANRVLKHRYTAYAVTDRRLLRVPLAHPLSSVLPGPKPDAWPVDQARVVEREGRGRRRRVRVQVESPSGKRLARFRLTPRDADGLVQALRH